MTTKVKQRINHVSSPGISMMKVHNNYIDAEQVTYEEVASVISNKDDPDMLCLTFRVWFIGLLLSASNGFVNQYFWYRSHNEFGLSSGLVILLSFLLGRLFDRILPTKCWSIGSQFRFSFNPGPFTFKEHILIFIMYRSSSHNISLSIPFDVQRLYYHQEPVKCIVGVIFCVSLSLMVFGIAGKFDGAKKDKVFNAYLKTIPNLPLHATHSAQTQIVPNWVTLSTVSFF
jgi:hypothetical protein